MLVCGNNVHVHANVTQAQIHKHKHKHTNPHTPSSKQRRATRKEVRELEELVESELKDARTTLNIQVSTTYYPTIH